MELFTLSVILFIGIFLLNALFTVSMAPKRDKIKSRKPFVAPHESSVYADCDDTLIMWDENHTQPFKGAVKVKCPYDGTATYHRPHKRHIAFLRKQKLKGYTIVVWSASGPQWASQVVKALHLEDVVDVVLGKPNKCLDDLPNTSDIIPSPIYLSEDGYST